MWVVVKAAFWPVSWLCWLLSWPVLWVGTKIRSLFTSTPVRPRLSEWFRSKSRVGVLRLAVALCWCALEVLSEAAAEVQMWVAESRFTLRQLSAELRQGADGVDQQNPAWIPWEEWVLAREEEMTPA